MIPGDPPQKATAVPSRDAEVAIQTDPTEVRFRLTLHYDGSAFHGWQVQPAVPTVQGAIEDVIARITGTRRPVIGSGRTDRGVHATGQVAAVQLPAGWEAGKLRATLNALLPKGIWVASVAASGAEFHPRYDAIDRTYRYEIGLGEDAHSPFRRPWCWPLARTPDLTLLESASATVVGDHSFRSFAKTGQPERGDRCTVHRAQWLRLPDGLRWTVTANRYLHHMVRYLVGTMVDIGLGRRALEDLPELLSGSDHLTTSKPAPPEGLYLHAVRYPDDDPSSSDADGSS